MLQTVDLIQGSPEWHAHRDRYYNASDAPVMMGVSKYRTRDQLVAQKAGYPTDEKPIRKELAAMGHALEKACNPLVEAIFGQELYPVVGINGPYSASYDGLLMDEDGAGECKTSNDTLRGLLPEYTSADKITVCPALPRMYTVQLEHQILVCPSIERVLFYCAVLKDGQAQDFRACWYLPNRVLRAEIVHGWEQFSADVAAYRPPEPAAQVIVPVLREMLPALQVEAKGVVTASNLDDYKARALKAIATINLRLDSDQDFATAKADGKWCREVADNAARAEQSILSGMAGVNAAIAAIQHVGETARRTAIELEKLVDSREKSIKAEIIAQAAQDLRAHIAALNATLPMPYLPLPREKFAEAIKGKRTLDTVRNAVNTELARLKTEVAATHARVRANLAQLPPDYAPLFTATDLTQALLKPEDDFAAWAQMRIANAKQAAEAARARDAAEAERQRSAPDERARFDAEMAAPAQSAPTASQAPEAQPAPPPAADPLSAAAPYLTPLDNGWRFTLGDLNDAIAPLSISASGMEALGIPFQNKGVAKVYRTCDMDKIFYLIISKMEIRRKTIRDSHHVLEGQ